MNSLTSGSGTNMPTYSCHDHVRSALHQTGALCHCCYFDSLIFHNSTWGTQTCWISIELAFVFRVKDGKVFSSLLLQQELHKIHKYHLLPQPLKAWKMLGKNSTWDMQTHWMSVELFCTFRAISRSRLLGFPVDCPIVHNHHTSQQPLKAWKKAR